MRARAPSAAAASLDEWVAMREAMLADGLPPSPWARATLKSRPAPGGGRYRLEKVQCGKQCSTCARGPEHGPYWYLYYRRSGKLVSRYIGKQEPAQQADVELLEARDLLFARLLQYRAYKEVTAMFARRMSVQSRRFPRRVPMEPQFAELLPQGLLGLGAAEFAVIAARALAPRGRRSRSCWPWPAMPASERRPR